MKKVLLIGDSIREGYDEYVKEALKAEAEVYFPQENCKFAQYTLRYLHEWANNLQIGTDVDCVHWNVGLWDCLILYDDGTMTPLPVYCDFVDRICKRIKALFPNAQIIFATTTPGQEKMYQYPSARLNEDVRRFNEAAKEIVLKYGGIINDLYALVTTIRFFRYAAMHQPA